MYTLVAVLIIVIYSVVVKLVSNTETFWRIAKKLGFCDEPEWMKDEYK